MIDFLCICDKPILLIMVFIYLEYLTCLLSLTHDNNSQNSYTLWSRHVANCAHIIHLQSRPVCHQRRVSHFLFLLRLSEFFRDADVKFAFHTCFFSEILRESQRNNKCKIHLRCLILRLKCTKLDFDCHSFPDATGEHTVLPQTL